MCLGCDSSSEACSADHLPWWEEKWTTHVTINLTSFSHDTPLHPQPAGKISAERNISYMINILPPQVNNKSRRRQPSPFPFELLINLVKPTSSIVYGAATENSSSTITRRKTRASVATVAINARPPGEAKPDTANQQTDSIRFLNLFCHNLW